jgi:hypothetical protein
LRIGKQSSVADFVADHLHMFPKLRVGQPVRQQVQTLQNRETGFYQRQKLLVKDQELL